MTILCLVLDEEAAVPLFFHRLCEAMRPLAAEFEFELLFIDNCSSDSTADAIAKLQDDIFEIYYIRMSRNFGIQASINCGLLHATGALIFNIDVDCEDPPELIPRFVDRWREGFDIVYGNRKGRPESKVLLAARRLFYRATSLIADADFVIDMGDFLLMTAEVRDAVVRSQTSHPFVRSEIGYVGFRRIGIPYDRQKRIAGTSTYTIGGLFQVAIGGVLTASTAPLRFTAYVGAPLFLLNAVYLVLSPLGVVRGGYDWLMVLDLSFVVFAITFLSMYLARVYKNGLMRPPFIIDQTRSRLPPRRQKA